MTDSGTSAPVADVTPKPARRERSFWRADTVVTRSLARFEAASEAGREDRQRSAFYQLAKYQARTLGIIHTSLQRGDEPLLQAALQNIMTLHRGLLHMHRRIPHLVPLPILIREQGHEDLTSDLIMRVLKESGATLPVPAIVERLRDLGLLGAVRAADIEDNIDRLQQAGYVRTLPAGHTATRLPYSEIDMNMRGLRTLLSPALYEQFRAARFRRLSHVSARPVEFQNTFARITGMTDPTTSLLFQETAEMVFRVSLAAIRPWHFHDLVESSLPRPYQREAYRMFKRNGYRSSVIEAPTGSGKTLIGMMCAADGLRNLQPGQTMLVLVPTAAYQQQWLAALCFQEVGLQLSPEIVFAGSPAQLTAHIRRTGQHPAIALLTYTGLAQLGSGAGKGGFDAVSVEMLLQEANIQYVVLDEVHKVVSDMRSVSTDITRLLVQWRADNSIRALVGFSGTAEAYRRRFEDLGLDLVHSIPIDDLVAAGFVAPFTELGVPFASSAREQQVRDHLAEVKETLIQLWRDVGGDRLRAWFAQIPMQERLRIGHDALGMYRARKDWEPALRTRMESWESGGDLALTEANLALIVQLANGWSDTELARQAEVPDDAFAALRSRAKGLRQELGGLLYRPRTLKLLHAPGFMTQLDVDAVGTALAQPTARARNDGVKDAVASTLTGLYQELRGWYSRVGEGRVEAIKAIIEAERDVRDVSGTIVFSAGRRIRWREGVSVPGYEGVAGLFGQMLGDSRFTVLAALSSELYLSHSEAAPLPEQIADYIEKQILLGESSEAILTLAVQGIGLPEREHDEIASLFRRLVARYVPSLRDVRAPRPADFHRRVIRPVQRRAFAMNVGVAGHRLVARLERRNEHLGGLIGTFFDYAMIARSFRHARVAELEQVSGQRQRFFVVPMPSSSDRRQLVYELTSRIVDAESLPVNMIIVSSWARTGWNVISPNLLIDATATSDVTAWQQLRGRAIRADRRWTNDCYRLESLLLDADVLTDSEPGTETPGDDGVTELDHELTQLLDEVAEPAQARAIRQSGFTALDAAERDALACTLMQRRNKVTHVYELVKAYGSTSQVTYDRAADRWRRKDTIAAKHAREVAVNALTGEKSRDATHAPLLYADDPRQDLPEHLHALLSTELRGSDERIVRGWLGRPAPASDRSAAPDDE
jgi:hypothetical protein